MQAEEQQQIHRFLDSGAWFGGLPPDLQSLILSRSIVRKFGKGQVMSLEDSEPDALFAVLEGRVYCVREVGRGEEALIHVGEPGFWFGALHLLTGGPTVVTVLARTPVRALVLPKAQFDRILAEAPRFYEHFARLALARYAVLIRWLVELRDLDPEGRVRTRLASMAQLRRQDGPVFGAVSLVVPQADLARMAGVSRQTLNAILGKLSAERLVEVGFGRIRVLDAARLADPNTRDDRAEKKGGDARRRVSCEAPLAGVKRGG